MFPFVHVIPFVSDMRFIVVANGSSIFAVFTRASFPLANPTGLGTVGNILFTDITIR
jgi:hypothetical protein